MARSDPKGMVSFGAFPPVPIVKMGDWKSEKASWDEAWHLVGPTIRENMHRIKIGEQYKLYCIAFIEGMRMAIHSMQEREREQEQNGNQEPTPPHAAGGLQDLGSASRVHYSSYPEECSL